MAVFWQRIGAVEKCQTAACAQGHIHGLGSGLDLDDGQWDV